MTRLAIVGASVRAAAQSALRAGFEVVGADLFADVDLDGFCPVTRIDNYPDGLADWLAEQNVDAWMYTGALENYPELVDRMAEIAPLWGVSGEALRVSRNPIHDAFDIDARVPATYMPPEVPKRDGSWLAKTYRHSCGQGVRRLVTDADWQQAAQAGEYVQRFIPGRQMAAVFAIGQQGATLLGVTEQTLAGEFCYRGSIGPRELSVEQSKQLTRLGRSLSMSLGLRGLVGVDLVVDESGIWVVEINPRYTASVEVLERATGRSAVAAHAAAFGCEAAPVEQPPEGRMAKHIVYATERTTVTRELFDWMENEGRAGRLADQPRLGEVIEAGQPMYTRFESLQP